MNKYNKISGYGPGGRNCICCGPAPKIRKRFDRIVKRNERQVSKENMQKEILDNQT
jgi:hypothetical protein